MAIIDKDGFISGRLGDRIYYRLGKRLCFRDIPKGYHDPATPDQKLFRGVFKGAGVENIYCIIVNAKLTGQEPEKFVWNDYTQARLITSRTLAVSCGWTEPMLLLLEGPNPKPFQRIKPEIVWMNMVNDRICILTFTTSFDKHYLANVRTVRAALRVFLTFSYHSIGIQRKVIAFADVPVQPQENLSIDDLPDFYQPKAKEFLAARFGSRREEYKDKLLKGARFAALELGKFPAPKHKFLRERIKFACLSDCNLHIKVDLVGMMEKKYGENSFYCCLRSRFSDEVVLKLPRRELDSFGIQLAAHLSRLGKAERDKRFSDPKKRAALNEYHREYSREWRQNNPQKAAEYESRANERKRIRYNTDQKYRTHKLEYRRQWRKNNPEKYAEQIKRATARRRKK